MNMHPEDTRSPNRLKYLQALKFHPNVESLIQHVITTLPNEKRSDVLWRHAILSRQIGQFIGVAITHHPELTPDARPMTGLDDAASDVLVQTLYMLASAEVDLDKVAGLALARMKEGVWKKTLETQIDGKPTGQLAEPWRPSDQPLEAYLYNEFHELPLYPEEDGKAVLFLTHLDNDDVHRLKGHIDKGRIVAVVTKNGGMLSHAANVCREWNIPCVVGVGATVTIPTGARVRLTADRLSQRASVEVITASP